ncbi:hypothetical protein WA1_48630 [Scytonema hofmannii PCC 7110]|uniref:CHAT domain-containing protein n=2 Tax=Scytonema hofmannii TaxID=34078 RepID=A0A139WTZ1_9CYAN|nr:hypothetical protein WA1_48630 [Scytonema hofmannii PCC 7110]
MTPLQRKQLRDALISAFPERSLLEQLLDFDLDKKLNQITLDSNLQSVVYQLIKTAQAQGWLVDLVRAAYEENPGNSQLATIAQELLTPEIPSVKSLNIPSHYSNKEDAIDKYHKQVEAFAEDGEISFGESEILKDLQKKLKLTEEEVRAVRDKILEPFGIYKENLDKYRQVFTKWVDEQGYPLLEKAKADLKKLQEHYQLKHEDIALLEKEAEQQEVQRLQRQREQEEASRRRQQQSTSTASTLNTRLEPINHLQKILILAANPKGTSQLRLDEELREIEQGLQRARQREQFEIKSALAVRSRDIHRSILDFKPNIVHFSGHGAGLDGLIFEDETGQAKLVDALALARLFKLFGNRVKCVVLNACYSEIQAKAIAQHIDYVIGMRQAVGDKAAIEFAVGFYDALGAGESIEFAYELGCTLIQIQGIAEELTPKLLDKKQLNDSPNARGQDCNPPSSEVIETRSTVVTEDSDDALSSEKGIDYTKLRNFLKAGQWKEADYETYLVMLQAVGRSEGDWIRDEELLNFPCTDLRTIDRLWVKYSSGRFGFSIQKQIYLEVGGLPDGNYYKEAWEKFGDRVGWRVEESWIGYGEVTFDTVKVPRGHLPGGFWCGFWVVSLSSTGVVSSSLALRLAKCNL